MKGLLKDAFTVVFARGFIRLAQLLSFVLLARFLSPSEFGWFGLVTTGMALAATLGSLGLRQSSAYQIGQGLLSPAQAVGTILTAWLPLAVVTAAVFVSVYDWRIPDARPWQVNLAMLVGIAGTMLVMMLQGVLLGRGKIKAFSATETLPRVVLALAAVVLALTAWATAINAVWAHALSFAVVAPVALVLANRGGGRISLRLDRIPSLVSYGAVFALNLFLITLCARLSMFVIERLYDSAEAGRFFAAVRVNDIVLEAAAALGLVVFSRSVRTQDAANVAQKTARIVCWMFWAFAFGAVFVAVFATWLVPIVLGAGYSESGDALRVLAVGLPAAAANKIIYPAIAGQGRPWFGTTVIMLGIVANLVAALCLVPTGGVVGGALALVVGQYVMLVGYVFTCRRAFQVPATLFFLPQRGDLSRAASTIWIKLKGRSI